jgi:protein gp37
MSTTKIEYATDAWNPVTGCTMVSEGCRNCWAARLAATRLKHYPRYRGLATYPDLRGAVPQWTGEVRLHPELLNQPLHWRKPKRVFVCSQADLFHVGVDYGFITGVMAAIARCPQHTFLLLTKRSDRMYKYFTNCGFENHTLPNFWLGVSVEDQKTADKRIPLLLHTPAAVRWVSYEPALGPVNLQNYLPHALYMSGETPSGSEGLDWVIGGGESGPNAQPSHPDWFRTVRDQCQAAGVPFFFKQWGEWGSDRPADQHKISGHRYQYDSMTFRPDGTRYNPTKPDELFEKAMQTVYQVGKKAAGRLLDGREWNEFPRTP